MPFQVSPGVNVSEIDLTTVVPAVSTTEGGLAGVFRWGPINELVLISSETNLVNRFGKPTNHNPETFFTAASFLSYGNKLYVSRAANTVDFTGANGVLTAIANSAAIETSATCSSNNSGVNASSEFITSSHTFSDGDAVKYTVPASNTVITGLTNNSIYYIISSNTSGFKVAATVGGAAINLTNTAFNETHTFTKQNNVLKYVVKNRDDYDAKLGDFQSAVQYVARYPGALGNSLKVSVCGSNTQYNSTVDLRNWNGSTTTANMDATAIAFTVGSSNAVVTIANAVSDSDGSITGGIATNIKNLITIGDYILAGNTTLGTQYLKVTAKGDNVTVNNSGANTGSTTFTLTFDTVYSLSTSTTSNNVVRYWEYFNNVDKAPGQSTYVALNGNTSAKDELHVVVADEDGKFTGVPGAVLEVYKGLSRATDAKTADGATNYYKNVINDTSSYIWWASDRTGSVSNTALNVTSSTNSTPLTTSFAGGSDGADENNVSVGVLASAYDLFGSAEKVDVSLILTGKSRGGTNGEQLANYLIDNIAEDRKDCVVFVSPEKATVVNNAGEQAADIVTFRNGLRSTSYGVLDSGYKYMYDKYNDLYRYIPLNGDTAGLCVRTDTTRDPWFSPAGFNRGQVKNIIKLAYNPDKADRDILYKNGINPVVTFPGQGTVLFGDKTLLAKPSAFDRINVRRLFIVLEKAVATAAKFTLFEFNDEFTRAQFKNLVEPFLRDVQGRRGIYDFKVVCDESNNTGEVIDRNEFIGDIYIKPARSINFIQLNFVAVRTGVEFSEVVGQF